MTQQENPAMNRKKNPLVDEPNGNMANLLPNQAIGPSGSIVIARNRQGALWGGATRQVGLLLTMGQPLPIKNPGPQKRAGGLKIWFYPA
jgi:hypothetical protein